MSSFDHPPFRDEDPQKAIRQRLNFLISFGQRYPLDMETVQFLRARRHPNSQVHDVKVQDTMGKQQSFRFLVCRQSDDSWVVVQGRGHSQSTQHRSSGSSDHPELYLAAGGINAKESSSPLLTIAYGEIMNILRYLQTIPDGEEKALALTNVLEERLGTTPEEERGQAAWEVFQEFQYLLPPQEAEEKLWNPWNHFYAYGEVIDHGFDIVGVRLISPNGLVLEDTVEEGLVLFWSNEYPKLPLQAELYNRAGELVSSQTVFQPWPFKA